MKKAVFRSEILIVDDRPENMMAMKKMIKCLFSGSLLEAELVCAASSNEAFTLVFPFYPSYYEKNCCQFKM